MKWSLLPLLLIGLTAPTHAMELEGSLHIGAGRPVGTGTDVYQVSPVISAGVGARLTSWMSLEAQLHLGTMRLESSVSDDGEGQGQLLVLAPIFHLLARHAPLGVEFAPIVGMFDGETSSTYSSTTVKFHAHGLVAGAQAALTLPIDEGWSFGGRLTYARMYSLNECTQRAGVTTCDADANMQDQGVIYGTLGSRWTF